MPIPAWEEIEHEADPCCAILSSPFTDASCSSKLSGGGGLCGGVCGKDMSRKQKMKSEEELFTPLDQLNCALQSSMSSCVVHRMKPWVKEWLTLKHQVEVGDYTK
jgi:hypothetical protein